MGGTSATNIAVKRRLIPPTTRDKLIAFIGTPIGLLILLEGIRTHDSYSLVVGLNTIVGVAIVAYGLQSPRYIDADAADYTPILHNIEAIGVHLAELDQFVKAESHRLTETKAFLQSLNEERAKLEPLLKTDRAAVEAILAANAAQIAKHAWKERAVGFLLGVVGSLLASAVYEYFRR